MDSDVIDRLIAKEEHKEANLESNQREILSSVFRSQLPQIKKVEFNVETQALGENGAPIMITQSEYMRRMKEMANIQAGMSFYGEMPDMFNLVLNSEHKLIKEILAEENEKCASAIAPTQLEMDSVDKQRIELKQNKKARKQMKYLFLKRCTTWFRSEMGWTEKQKETVWINYATNNKVVRQLIDLALLQNGMLKGEALNNFVKEALS